MGSEHLRRRRFIQLAAASASAAAVSCGRGGSPWRVFTVAEAEAVSAIGDRIIPADRDAGAASADVVNYIDRQLTGPLKKYKRPYQEGLAAIDRLSAARHGKRFAGLSNEQKDELLTLLDSGQAPADRWNPAEAKSFFDMIRDHTMQSYYGDPRHGGNREYASWRMMGIPPAPVRGRNLYDLSGEGLASKPRRTSWRSRG